tara:strand:+ start:101 stop:349 length:249 start_codon:yes stop_codon:yes gene_type:complete
MSCLLRRDDNTIAYISKDNSVLLGRTPRSKPKKHILSVNEVKIILDTIEDISNKILTEDLNPLQKQYYHRRIVELCSKLESR